MDLVRPRLLRRGDTVRVVAPSRSRAVVRGQANSALIPDRFAAMGLRLTFGAHVDERDAFDSSSIASRIADLHDAFADPGVAGILTVIGGYNANELLPFLDYELVRAHPKVFCGYSDITALQNALLARSGLVTFSGPHWSTFGMRDHLDQTVDWFRQGVLDNGRLDGRPLQVRPAREWTDDPWFLDQDDRHPMPNDGWWPLRPGTAAGRIVGGNLCTLNLLQGTPWMPSLDGAMLFVEDDSESSPHTFARDLTSLLQLPDAAGIRGLVIGRFQRQTGMTRELLAQIVGNQPGLAGLPVLANADFGHTQPLLTFPVGGQAEVRIGAVTGAGRDGDAALLIT